ncbi:MAG TPA: alpha/beta fold hydrolase [Kofleriaceae bacterium]|jgi:pimeloyl-ACP methyl ester carboxylesterase
MGISDAIGFGRLAVQGVRGLTDAVESMHSTIASFSPVVGAPRTSRTWGFTRLVYQAIRGVTSLVGGGVELAAALASVEDEPPSSPRREVMLSVLNGVVGDHLVATNNPLAMPMRLHVNPHTAIPDPTGRILLLVHGLCASHLHWTRNGRDHGALLAASNGFTPVYASYNSGRHISTNGRDLAAAIETLVADWPVPVEEVVLLGHSMGGLVARSACSVGATHAWRTKLSHLICIGSPHHGAPLERAGNFAQTLLSISPYAAPIARLGNLRSAGVTDLRFGNVRDEDWNDVDAHHRHDPRAQLALPDVRCYAIAATFGTVVGDAVDRLRGDGLVPVASALGQHEDPAFRLGFHATHVVTKTGHLDLLDSLAVHEQLARWLT